MFCPNCGAPNEKGAAKCVQCGKLLPQLSPTGELVLPVEQPSPPAGVPGPFGGPPGDNRGPIPGPGAQAGLPGSQYSYNYGPGYNSGYSQYAPYYNYSVPADRVGVATVEAGFWLRFGAYLIDSIILGLMWVLLFVVPVIVWLVGFISRHQDEILPVCDSSRVGYSSARCNDVLNAIFQRTGEFDNIAGIGLGLFGLALLLNLVYYVILTARGATLGKKVFGLKVVKKDGTLPGLGRALLRQTVGYFVSSIFGLGFLWIAFDPQRQGWHDKIAGTYVVRTY